MYVCNTYVGGEELLLGRSILRTILLVYIQVQDFNILYYTVSLVVTCSINHSMVSFRSCPKTTKRRKVKRRVSDDRENLQRDDSQVVNVYS